MLRLEDPLQSELDAPRLGSRNDPAGCGPADPSVWTSEHRGVREVERLEAELQVVAFPWQVKPARQRKVQSPRSGSPDQVPSSIVEYSRAAGHDRIGVEPAVDGPLRLGQVQLSDQVAAVRAAHVGGVLVERMAVRRAPQEVENAANLPATQDPCPGAARERLLAGAEGQLVDEAGHPS